MTIKRLTKADHPRSLGAFKPVGHVVVAMPDDASAALAVAALHEAGFDDDDILQYSASEEGDEMERMLRYTSDFAGFGYEVSLMRRYQQLAKDGASWLIVFAPDEAHTARVTEAVRRHGALIAEKYHRLVIEDLL